MFVLGGGGCSTCGGGGGGGWSGGGGGGGWSSGGGGGGHGGGHGGGGGGQLIKVIKVRKPEKIFREFCEKNISFVSIEKFYFPVAIWKP